LVSREFGKPCIVGIENVTNILKDGEIVEVDAINGIVKRNVELK
jgi:phosphohistidine swiveling domain-containing protein